MTVDPRAWQMSQTRGTTRAKNDFLPSRSLLTYLSILLIRSPSWLIRRTPAVSQSSVVVDVVVNADEYGALRADTHIANLLLHVRNVVDITYTNGAEAQFCDDDLADILVGPSRNR